MAAADSGCHLGNIENGHVVTYSCLFDTGIHRFYCNYHCESGYFKTSSRVFCAGNELWLPADPNETLPCIPDDRLRTTQNATVPRTTIKPLPPFLPIPTTKQPHLTKTTTAIDATTRWGYYRDPQMEMNISPAIFVGAVVGGIIAVVLIVFAIFFRAHRKAHRQCRERSMVCVDASNPAYPDQTYDNIDDSMYRGIVQRITANANQSPGEGNQTRTDTQYSPPPYEDIAPINTAHSNVPECQPHNRSPPYTAIDSIHAVFPQNPTTASNNGHMYWNTHGNAPDVLIGDLDEPPPYEESIKTTDQPVHGNSCDSTKNNGHNIPPPPPPYSDC